MSGRNHSQRWFVRLEFVVLYRTIYTTYRFYAAMCLPHHALYVYIYIDSSVGHRHVFCGFVILCVILLCILFELLYQIFRFVAIFHRTNRTRFDTHIYTIYIQSIDSKIYDGILNLFGFVYLTCGKPCAIYHNSIVLFSRCHI